MKFIVYINGCGEYDRISGTTYEDALKNSGYNDWEVSYVGEDEDY